MTHSQKLKQLKSYRPLLFIANNRLFTGLMSLFFMVGLLVGIVRYQTYLDGFDYSIFTQTLWHYSNFQAPQSSLRDVNNILGDHFHPLLVVLTPLFWIWDNPLALTVVQPFLFALSAIPIYLLAKKHFKRNNALLISAAYLLSHGLQFALFFDFHEIALAVPIVSLIIYSIDIERYTYVVIGCVLLCLLKEELVLLSVMVGVVLMVRNRKYKLGASISVLSLAFFMMLTKFLMPLLAGKDKYNAYWTYSSYGSGPVNLFKNALTNPVNFLSKLYHDIFTNRIKTGTLWLLLFSSGLSVFFSWYILLAVPDLAIRMLSDSGTYYWNYYFHYGAILMPIIFFCFIDVLRKLQKRLPSKVLTVACLILFMFSFGVSLNKNFPFARITDSQFYSLNNEVRSGEAAVHQIVGANSSITAPVVLTPHFANRQTVRLLTDPGRWYTDENIVLTKAPDTDYVVLNDKLPITDVEPTYKYSDFERDLTPIGYNITYQDKVSGWIVYKKLQ